MCYDCNSEADPSGDDVGRSFSRELIRSTIPTETSGETSAESVLKNARDLASRGEDTTIELAPLIDQIECSKCWDLVACTFRKYVEEVLGMKLRTVQEMLKVYRACKKFAISQEQVKQFGWSKVAIVASRLTPENRDEVLADLDNQKLSYSKLRAKYTPSRAKVSAVKPDAPDTDSDEQLILRLSPVVMQALCHAYEFTESDDGQTNLEHVAQRFIELSTGNRIWQSIAVNN